MSQEIDDMLKEFQNYNFKFNFQDLGMLLFQYEKLLADFLALRKMVIEHIHSTTMKDKDELYDELENKTTEIFRELWADFVAQRGNPKDNKNGD